ncbi:MAG TPA: histidinol phosphate phosphatase domain-containing protein [Syntrophales bacterium]|nr:histidinol phosphate phosphatase domain-containing protein [Syntrophales bacterium]HPO35708.1 histidinol phosphate phosphatase domain-containing protein [Syntrophales bacterium]
MIDFHTHSTFSDGELIPAELVRRAQAKGYRAIAITDHGDQSNLDFIIPRLKKVCQTIYETTGFLSFPGIELTHVVPSTVSSLTREARALGAAIVLVHGETIVEPVCPGTNRAAIEASVDILAHPGLISAQEAKMAAEKGVFLEITTRRGHSLTNGHVLKMARLAGARLIINTDAHSPDDLTEKERAALIASGAGMERGEIREMFSQAEKLLTELKRRMGWL